MAELSNTVDLLGLLSFPVQICIIALLIVIFLDVAIQLLGIVSTILFHFSKPPKLDTTRPLPGVTIIKPCLESDDNEEENFDGFFNQDYPGKVELLFVVGDESHPIVPVIKKYLKRYPERDARLLVSKTREACSPKINSLFDGHQAAKNEIIIWSDSDVIVRPSYVSEMVACLQEPGVSVVTTPQYDTRANTFGSAFKVLANNCDVATLVMGYRILTRRKRVAWGHSSGFWKKEFDSFGPETWHFLNRFLADDLGLPRIFDAHGKKIAFRNIYCPVETSNKTVAQMVSQKKRWVMCQRLVIGNRFIYFLGVLVYPQVPAALLLLLTGFAPWSIALFFGLAALRIAISGLFEFLYLDSVRMTVRYFWTILLWDLAQIYFFWHGFSTNTITFRGKDYQILGDYSLKPENTQGGRTEFSPVVPEEAPTHSSPSSLRGTGATQWRFPSRRSNPVEGSNVRLTLRNRSRGGSHELYLRVWNSNFRRNNFLPRDCFGGTDFELTTLDAPRNDELVTRPWYWYSCLPKNAPGNEASLLASGIENAAQLEERRRRR